MNRQEQEFKDKLNEEIQIPKAVKNKADEAFQTIKSSKSKARDTRSIRKKILVAAGSVAAVFAAFFVFGMANPVMASQLPIIGHIFEQIQDNYSYPGDFSSVAEKLGGNSNENPNGKTALADDKEAATDPATDQASDQATDQTSDPATNQASNRAADSSQKEKDLTTPARYSQTADGVTMTLSELYCNDQALYMTLELTSEKAFPVSDIFARSENNQPIISFLTSEKYSFNEEAQEQLYYLEGKFVDDYTYAGIIRIDYKLAAKVVSDESLQEYNDAYEAAEAAGKDPMKEDIQLDVQNLEIPDNFKLNLDIKKIITDKANPDVWDSGYTGDELAAMSDEEWKSVMNKQPAEWNQFPNEHENIWWNGSWNFDLDINVDRSRTKVIEINNENENGLGIASVEITPFELKVNQLNEGTTKAADTFPVVLDASGKMLPYGNSSNVTDYAVYGADISKLDIYLCDYIEYMDEIKGHKTEDNFKQILDERAIYHTTVETGITQ